MLPLIFLVGLVFGVKRWPAVLAVVVTWPLIVWFIAGEPPSRMDVFWLVVLGNAVAGVAMHEVTAALRWGLYSAFRTLGHRREAGTSV